MSNSLITISYLIKRETRVLVSDRHLGLHKHVMKHDRYIDKASQALAVSKDLAFTDVDNGQRWSIRDLKIGNMWVFAMGDCLWPYLIVPFDYILTDKAAYPSKVPDDTLNPFQQANK